MAGVDVEKRHRDVRRTERLFREAQQADGILAAGKEQGGALKFGRDFTHDVNRLGFEILQMVEMIAELISRKILATDAHRLKHRSFGSQIVISSRAFI